MKTVYWLMPSNIMPPFTKSQSAPPNAVLCVQAKQFIIKQDEDLKAAAGRERELKTNEKKFDQLYRKQVQLCDDLKKHVTRADEKVELGQQVRSYHCQYRLVSASKHLGPHP